MPFYDLLQQFLVLENNKAKWSYLEITRYLTILYPLITNSSFAFPSISKHSPVCHSLKLGKTLQNLVTIRIYLFKTQHWICDWMSIWLFFYIKKYQSKLLYYSRLRSSRGLLLRQREFFFHRNFSAFLGPKFRVFEKRRKKEKKS